MKSYLPIWRVELSNATQGTKPISLFRRDAHVEQVAKWWASGGRGSSAVPWWGPLECKGRYSNPRRELIRVGAK